MTAAVGAHASDDVGAALLRRLGAAGVVDAEARQACAIAGLAPTVVARPADADALAETVAAAAAVGAALVPLGRGAHRGFGHPPARYDAALVTDGLNRIHDYTPADMTVTVEAGTTFDDLQTLLARDGQWLPLEPPLPAATTVGGLLAADLAGPLAASEGRVRDYVIGMRMVTAAGVAVRAGGRVVKNVAGYDLMKLFIGSLGTLAVLTEATLKVRPLPERQHGLVLAVRGMRAALELGAAIDGALAVFVEGDLGDREPPASAARVVVRLGGVAADVAALRARLLASAQRDGAVIEVDTDADDPTVRARFATGRDFPAVAEGKLVVRLATLPARLSAVAAAATAELDPTTGRWLADPRRGVLTLALATAAAPAPALLAALTHVADAHGAHLVVERFPSELASTITVWHPLPPALPLMRRMKAALDPGGVLAPGRFVGRL